MNEVCFQLKGSVLTVLVLEFQQFSTTEFIKQLKQRIAQAPRLLHRSPVVISLEKLTADVVDIDFAALVEDCREQGLQPLGFKGDGPLVAEAGRATGLAVFPKGNGARRDEPSLAEGKAQNAGSAPEVRPSKLITQPVRSGQQVYAQGCDLVITSQVSEGAEVLADGHIHCYGPLRGRALAGVQGDEDARIFCRSLEAELVSVAGHFLLSESLLSESSRDRLWKQPAQVRYDGVTLCVDAL